MATRVIYAKRRRITGLPNCFPDTSIHAGLTKKLREALRETSPRLAEIPQTEEIPRTDQKNEEERIAHFFASNHLSTDAGMIPMKGIMHFIEADGTESERSTRLRIIQTLHATIIGAILDDDSVVKYVCVKTMRERIHESRPHRACPFKALFVTPDSRYVWGRSLTKCYRNGTPLWSIQKTSALKTE